MGKSNMAAAMFLILFFVSVVRTQAESVFNVRNYGGKPNTDITLPLSDAFDEACENPTASKVVISKGTYKLGQVSFNGPCRKPVEIQVQGTLIALTEGKLEEDSSWINFQHIDHLTLSGGGTFDGQGPTAWGTCAANSDCKNLPVNLRFNTITNGIVQDITSKDSKQFHVTVLGSKNLSFQRITITAPESSTNTDGIHVIKSDDVNITDSTIATGDNCISIGEGSEKVTVTKVTCGQGHGISVGSLGKYENEEPVIGVEVRNCTISNAMNGVRIKTWPASFEGSVSNMHFEDIVMNNVSTPVLIDQVYCPWNQCNAKFPSQVKINNVVFKNIRGTSATPVAVKLACSSAMPCQGVDIEDIDLTYSGNEGEAVSQCSNVEPKVSGKMNPPACTSAAITP